MVKLIRNRKYFLFVLMLLLSANIVYGQTKKEKTRKKFQYEVLTDGNKVLSAYIFVKAKKGFTGVSGVEVDFKVHGDSVTNSLATIKTNTDGWAILHVDKSFEIPSDENGLSIYSFSFVGNDTLKGVDAKLKIIESSMKLTLDSTKDKNNVSVFVVDKSSNPLSKVKVIVSVERLYSLLTLYEGKTDSDGKIQFEFPNDIPGDRNGNLVIVASIVKDRKLGSVTVSKKASWGIPNTYKVTEDQKNMWTQSAPLWMEIAVFLVFLIIFIFLSLAVYNVVMMAKGK